MSKLILSSLEDYVYAEKPNAEPVNREHNKSDLQMEKTKQVSQEKSADILKKISVISLAVLVGYAIHRLCKNR